MMSQMGPSPGNFTGGAPSAQQEERKVLISPSDVSEARINRSM